MLRPLWRRALRQPVLSPLHGRAANFRSTAVVCSKWKSKFNRKKFNYNFPEEETGGERTSKNYIRYVVRQKRADARRALKDLLNGRSSNPYFYDEAAAWHGEEDRSGLNVEDWCDDPGGRTNAENPSKSRPRRQPRRSRRRGYKKGGRSFNDDDDDDDELGPAFQARFGSRCYTWSFHAVHSSNPFPGFHWREEPSGDKRRPWERDSDYDDDPDDHDHHHGDHDPVGLCGHRATLGLPARGPLTLGDVKIAFRGAALKWHPDRHQGSSQSVAEEQFKRCLDAYKSLCDALSSP